MFYAILCRRLRLGVKQNTYEMSFSDEIHEPLVNQVERLATPRFSLVNGPPCPRSPPKAANGGKVENAFLLAI